MRSRSSSSFVHHFGVELRYSLFFPGCDTVSSNMLDGLGRTYALLFGTQTTSYARNPLNLLEFGKAVACSEYGKLEAPTWEHYQRSNNKKYTLNDMMKADAKSNSAAVRKHLLNMSQNILAASQEYKAYGHWEPRLRALKAYMDEQRPRGFRGIWRDNRDSLQYYTFWGATIVVALTVISLILTIAQTVAAYGQLA